MRFLPLFALLVFAGCSSTQKSPSGSALTTEGWTRTTLQSRLMAFADLYANQVEDAAEDAARTSETLPHRIALQSARLDAVRAVVTIACDPDPVAGLLDMAALVSLQRLSWDEPWFEAEVGAGAAAIRTAQREMETEIWRVVEESLKAQLATDLRLLVEKWRAEHREQRRVATVRFDDVATIRGAEESITRLKKADGILAPLDRATREVEETRLLGERGLFLATRMPALLSQETELLVLRVIAARDVQGQLEAIQSASKSLERAAAVVEELPALIAREREELVKLIDARAGTAREIAADVRASTESSERSMGKATEAAKSIEGAAASIRESMKVMEGLLEKPDQPTRLDQTMVEVNVATKNISKAAEDIRAALESAGSLPESSGFRAGLKDLDTAAEKRVKSSADEGRSLIRYGFGYGVALVVIGCAVGFATALAWRRFAR